MLELSRRRFCATGLSLASLRAAGHDNFVRVSPRDSRYLELTDGTAYIPIGLNLIAPPERSSDGRTGLEVYEGWLEKLAAHGGNFARAWLSNPFWDVEHTRS